MCVCVCVSVCTVCAYVCMTVCVCDQACACTVAPHLGDGGVADGRLGGAVCVLVRGLHLSGPLVQESAGCEETAVSNTHLPLKVLTHTVSLVEVTQAGLIWQREEGKRVKTHTHTQSLSLIPDSTSSHTPPSLSLVEVTQSGLF